MSPGLFITGTDTGVGKTWVAGAIVRAMVGAGHRVGILKPVATGVVPEQGCSCGEDAAVLIAASGVATPPQRISPLSYEAPLAPAVAARLRGEPLALGRVLEATAEALAWWSDQGVGVMVVEGVGGLLCPLAEGATVADLAIALDYPLIVVARRGLGTLNHTLLTVEAARHRGLRVAGVVLNAAEPGATPDRLAEQTNAAELARRLDGIAVLAVLDHHPPQETLPPTIEGVHWFERAGVPRREDGLAACPGRRGREATCRGK
jgi:dethiobiotin synthetase